MNPARFPRLACARSQARRGGPRYSARRFTFIYTENASEENPARFPRLACARTHEWEPLRLGVLHSFTQKTQIKWIPRSSLGWRVKARASVVAQQLGVSALFTQKTLLKWLIPHPHASLSWRVRARKRGSSVTRHFTFVYTENASGSLTCKYNKPISK